MPNLFPFMIYVPVGETQDSPCGRISPLGQMSLGGKETQTSLGMLTHSGKQLEIIENNEIKKQLRKNMLLV